MLIRSSMPVLLYGIGCLLICRTLYRRSPVYDGMTIMTGSQTYPSHVM